MHVIKGLAAGTRKRRLTPDDVREQEDGVGPGESSGSLQDTSGFTGGVSMLTKHNSTHQVKPATDGLNLSRFIRDRPRLDPSMGRLIFGMLVF